MAFGSQSAKRKARPESALEQASRQPLMLGLFLPHQEGAWSPSKAPRKTSWDFDHNAKCARKADRLGFDIVFALAQWMGKVVMVVIFASARMRGPFCHLCRACSGHQERPFDRDRSCPLRLAPAASGEIRCGDRPYERCAPAQCRDRLQGKRVSHVRPRSDPPR